MGVLTAILPVFILLILGMVCGRFRIISQSGMDGVKKIVTHLMLPVVLFNALSTAKYDGHTAVMLLVMAAVALLSLGAGFLARPLLGGYKRYLPFLTSGFEGGLLGYPLYIALMGSTQLHNIATLDIANCIYAYTLYLALIMTAGKGKSSPKELLVTVLKAPAMYGVALGILFGLTNLTKLLLASPAGVVYTSAVNMFTAPVSALILLSVGYNLHFDGKVMAAALNTAGLRLIIQSALLGGILFMAGTLFKEKGMLLALLIYAFLPPMFVSPIYTDNEKDAAYASTTISVYMAVTLIAFTLLAVFK